MQRRAEGVLREEENQGFEVLREAEVRDDPAWENSWEGPGLERV